MTAELVAFEASIEDKTALQAIIDMLQQRLDAGELRDLAVIQAVRDDNGPGWEINFWGERQAASLLAGCTHLQFEMHYSRYEEVG